MVRDIQVVVWCDNDGEGGRHPDDEQTPAAQEDAVIVLLPPKFTKEKQVDLCQDCLEHITLKRLWELAEEIGQSPERVSRPSHRTPGKGAPGGSYSHAELIQMKEEGRRVGKRPSQDRKNYCLLCPLDYASDSGLRRHFTQHHDVPAELTSYRDFFGEECPICANRYGLLGSHTMKVHGYLTAEAFHVAKELGDPHGIVAKRREYVLANLIGQGRHAGGEEPVYPKPGSVRGSSHPGGTRPAGKSAEPAVARRSTSTSKNSSAKRRH